MPHKPNIHWIWNTEDTGHGTVLLKQLERAAHVDVVVAFARQSGLDEILETLTVRLAAGLTARFVVGLDFYQTEPPVLDALLDLSEDHDGALSLYLARSEATFHPKLYAFSDPQGGGSVVVGSANFTAGGLWNNYETSVQIDDPDGTHAEEVAGFIDGLIVDGVAVLASPAEVDVYRLRHAVYQKEQRKAETAVHKRLGAAASADWTLGEELREVLRQMLDDDGNDGFVQQTRLRVQKRRAAREKIKEMARLQALTPARFLAHYDELLRLFHSNYTLLGMHKASVANEPMRFRYALSDLVKAGRQSAEDAFGCLSEHFQEIDGAGINVLTEILHAFDPRHCAVMNASSVKGLAMAGFHDYPTKLDKHHLTPERYAAFCRHANLVREALGLKNLGELDAVFNYAQSR